MNKKYLTILASMVTVTLVGAVLLSGALNMQFVDAAPNTSSAFNSKVLGLGISPGEATKLVVEIDSPYGHETITSFYVFVTDNLVQQTGYTILRLQGPIMDDKRVLMHWVADNLNKMPNGLAASGTAIGANKIPAMTKPKEGETVSMIPMTGKVTLKVLDGSHGDIYSTKYIRQLEFKRCHVAGYHMGVMAEEKKPYFKDGIQFYEDVVFACAEVNGLTGSGSNSRGMIVERAINNDNRQIVNEKGELMITSREYRQPIVLESYKNVESKNVKKEILTRIELDKTDYKVGDVAVFTATFRDANNNPIDPDTIRAVYNGKIVELQKQDKGVYTFATAPLIKVHHQLIVSVDKSGFPTDTTYLSIPISRIS